MLVCHKKCQSCLGSRASKTYHTKTWHTIRKLNCHRNIALVAGFFVIIYMKILLDSDWLREVQFYCDTVPKRYSVQKRNIRYSTTPKSTSKKEMRQNKIF